MVLGEVFNPLLLVKTSGNYLSANQGNKYAIQERYRHSKMQF